MDETLQQIKTLIELWQDGCDTASNTLRTITVLCVEASPKLLVLPPAEEDVAF